jgi:glucose dehydrogenase
MKRLLSHRLSELSCWALSLGAISVASSIAVANPAMNVAPDAQTLLEADKNSDDWLLPAKSYFGNRYSTLSQVTPANVGTLSLAWKTEISDDGEQEASPIVSNGTMYISTPHDDALPLDVRTGKPNGNSRTTLP